MNKMKKWRFSNFSCFKINVILVYVLFTNCVHAQFKYVEGVVLDKESSEPVPYAMIIDADNKHIGTTSNSNGRFVLKINDSAQEINLCASSIGYKQSCLSTLPNIVVNIYLEPEVLVLNEVTIEAIDNAESYIHSVLNLLEQNTETRPFDSNFFYRETIQTDNKYSWFMEAVGIWHSEGFLFAHQSKKNYLKYYEYFLPKQVRSILHHPWTDFYSHKIRQPNMYYFFRAYRYLISQDFSMRTYSWGETFWNGTDLIRTIKFNLLKENKARKILKKYERNPGFSLSSGIFYISSRDRQLPKSIFHFKTKALTLVGH